MPLEEEPFTQDKKWWEIRIEQGSKILIPHGAWNLKNLPSIFQSIRPLINKEDKVAFDGSSLLALDTAGALVLLRMARPEGNTLSDIQLRNFSAPHLNIVDLVRNRLQTKDGLLHHEELGAIQAIGAASIEIWKKILQLISFLGESITAFWAVLLKPKLLRFKELFAQLEYVLVDAIPIVALVTYLIGVVVAYLFASQIERYGANIFIVDGVALAMCRELSPIIVAIIVAGRSGSAFTAQIGTMKLNEEVDALRTIGLSPMQVLVLPRVLALVIAMPALVFIGDIVGIFGGLMIADFYLGVTPQTFIDRLQTVLPLRSFIVGLVKAPVFACFIALIGCRMGLVVENNARSVGINTTSTVVQSIVSVILLNAAFAVIFIELGI